MVRGGWRGGSGHKPVVGRGVGVPQVEYTQGLRGEEAPLMHPRSLNTADPLNSYRLKVCGLCKSLQTRSHTNHKLSKAINGCLGCVIFIHNAGMYCKCTVAWASINTEFAHLKRCTELVHMHT